MQFTKWGLWIFSIISVTGGLLSCASQKHLQETKTAIFYPPPPDSARIQFLASYSSSDDFMGPPSRFKTFVTGKPDPVLIRKPYGLASMEGRLVVADPGVPGLQILDFGEKSFRLFSPRGTGAFRLPVNCALDEEGAIYVCDVERRQVVLFDRDLEYMGSIGLGQDFRPTDVVLKGDSVFVSDPPAHRICVFDRKSHELLYSFPEKSVEGDDAWLYNPVNLSVSGDLIQVTDFGHSRIKQFDTGGKYLGSVGSYGRNFGQFVRPKGISSDREGNLFVVDAGFQNIQVFNKKGQLMMFFGGPYQGPGDLYLPAKVLVDYENLGYFRDLVDPGYDLEYLILVTNQYGPDKLNVYGRISPK